MQHGLSFLFKLIIKTTSISPKYPPYSIYVWDRTHLFIFYVFLRSNSPIWLKKTYSKYPRYLIYQLVSFGDSLDSVVFMLRVPVLGGAQIIAFAGLIETTGFFQAASTTDGRGPREGQFAMKDSTETGEPGNYGVGFPNFLGKVEDPEARKSKLAAELANGRLAMMAIIGMFFQVRCWKALAVATPHTTAQTYARTSSRITHNCTRTSSMTYHVFD